MIVGKYNNFVIEFIPETEEYFAEVVFRQGTYTSECTIITDEKDCGYYVVGLIDAGKKRYIDRHLSEWKLKAAL